MSSGEPQTIDQLVEHGYADLGDVRLHYVERGEGPLVVLLHGFPEFWYSWRHQIPALADGGYRAVAVDMRGYNLSDKPEGVESYRLELLALDVAKLIVALGEERAHVVGHDWGGAVAWWFAMHHPERLDRLAVLNLPHPAWFDEMLRSPRQLMRSWYVFAFQLTGVAERAVSAGEFRMLRRAFERDPERPSAFDDEDIERFIEAIARPGALTAGINYYRAIVRAGPEAVRRGLARIEAPVLSLFGEKDRYLGREFAAPPTEWVPNARTVRFPEASHWLQSDRPEDVNAELVRFFDE